MHCTYMSVLLYVGYRQMTKVLQISHGVSCVRDQVARLLRQADPIASLRRRSQRLVR